MTKKETKGSKFRCPHCGASSSYVISVRRMPAESGLRRRRECQKCGGKCSTKEKLVVSDS